jgi:hypothetical protein
MEENNEQSEQQAETQRVQEAQDNISLGDAMAGVFSEPGETFSSVKRSLKKNYWLVPLIIVLAVSILSSILVLRDEELVSAIKDKQKIAMKERFDEAVKDGKMTREQANEQIEGAEKMMTGSMFVIFGIISSVVLTLIFFFLKALIYWGGLKIFKGSGTYTDMMNVLGLASVITAIQLIVDTALAIFTGKLLVNIGPVLLFTEEAVGKSMYTFIANFDLINIWYLVVVGIGLAKASSLKSAMTVQFLFALWMVWVLLTSFGPFGMFIGR